MTGKSTNASSNPIVTGCPAPITYLADLFLNLEDHLTNIIGDAVLEEEKRIRKSLPQKEAEWNSISKDFSINWNPKDLSFYYDVVGASNAKAASLEYGPPAKSLLRHEILNVNKTLGKQIDTKIKKFLGDKS
jgi:hypothetical protein